MEIAMRGFFDSAEWQAYTRLFVVRCTDGVRRAGPLMRRRNEQGQWEYRPMTATEEAEEVQATAW